MSHVQSSSCMSENILHAVRYEPVNEVFSTTHQQRPILAGA